MYSAIDSELPALSFLSGFFQKIIMDFRQDRPHTENDDERNKAID